MKIKAKEFTEIMESSVVVDPEGNEYRWKYIRKNYGSCFWALFIPLPSGSYVVRTAYNHQGAPYVYSALCPKTWVDESNSLDNFANYMINGNCDEWGGYETICSTIKAAANLVDIVNKYPKIDYFPVVVEVVAITFEDEFGDFEYNFNSFDETAHSFVEETKIYALDFEKFKR